MLLLSAAVFVVTAADPAAAENADQKQGLPCIYEGHLKTKEEWYGFLLNITIMTTGRISYELSYPAEKCCQNLLFYSEEQISIMKTRMNCWDKEALVIQEEHQILRLTPTFPWSGCHLSHPNSIPTYNCQGGRSFTTTSGGERPTTWYIGISNCHSMIGMELTYRIIVVGHIGECKSPYRIEKTTPAPKVEPPEVAEISEGDNAPLIADKVCVIEGNLNTTKDWYGFFSNISLLRGGSFKFRFSYPYQMQVQNILMYNMQDITKLSEDLGCWQKKGVIRAKNVPEQIIDLSYRASWNGCLTKNTSAGRTIVCQGQRRFQLPRRIYFAVSNCRSLTGLYLDYHLELTNYAGSMCSRGTGRMKPQDTAAQFLLLLLLGLLALSFTSPPPVISTTTPRR